MNLTLNTFFSRLSHKILRKKVVKIQYECYQIILVLHDKLFFFLSGIGTFELIRQAINCCKEMCEITREKKLDSSYLVPILEDGFLAASRGF